MHISTEEYELRRHVFDSHAWIQQKLKELTQHPDFEKLYYEKKGRNLKKLLEEAVPVCRLGLFLAREWNNIFIKCLTNTNPDEQNFDAVIEIEDLIRQSTQKIKVEVTSAETDETTMRRQALARNGFVHLTGSIKRDGYIIESKGEFVDVDEEVEKLISLVLQRIETKLINTYDETTSILVYINCFRKLGLYDQSKLIERATVLLRARRPKLYGVFFCYDWNLGIDGILSNEQRYDLLP